VSTFQEDFQRRLRAVLAKHTGATIPDGVLVVVRADGAGYDDDSRGMDHEIVVYADGAPWATCSYEEPGAGARLLADLDAVPDADTTEPHPAGTADDDHQ
jgi:hypothetical protein